MHLFYLYTVLKIDFNGEKMMCYGSYGSIELEQI